MLLNSLKLQVSKAWHSRHIITHRKQQEKDTSDTKISTPSDDHWFSSFKKSGPQQETLQGLWVPTGCSTNEDMPARPCQSLQKPDSLADNPAGKAAIANSVQPKHYRGMCTVDWVMCSGILLLATAAGQVQPQVVWVTGKIRWWAFALGWCCVFIFWTQNSTVKS